LDVISVDGHYPRNPDAVSQYLRERRRVTDMRVRVMNRFDKIIDQVVALGSKRIRGMSISVAIQDGTKLIAEADYSFLLELRNVRSKSFLSTLFDTVK